MVQCDGSSKGQSAMWGETRRGEFSTVGIACPVLPAGIYAIRYQPYTGAYHFVKMTIAVDDILDFPGSFNDKILKEAKTFWASEDKYSAYKFLHKRGYLLYGKPGTGKSSLVQQMMKTVINLGGVGFYCGDPEGLVGGLRIFRQIEPARPILCVYEDLDAIVKHYGESEFLALIDGEVQVDHVLHVATTNYPEELDKRITNRPRRFDRVLEVPMPQEQLRRLFFQKKLSAGNGTDLEEWVKASEGFSIGALAEMVISIKCLGETFDTTVENLRQLQKIRKPAKPEYPAETAAGVEQGGQSVRS